MKSQLHFVLGFGFVLVLVSVLHLNVLTKHNKWNLWQVNTSLPYLFPRILKNLVRPGNFQGTERRSEKDRQTAHINHQW